MSLFIKYVLLKLKILKNSLGWNTCLKNDISQKIEVLRCNITYECKIDDQIKKQAITILNYNLRDNCNSYVLQEDGTYKKKSYSKKSRFNVFEEFYKINKENINDRIIL